MYLDSNYKMLKKICRFLELFLPIVQREMHLIFKIDFFFGGLLKDRFGAIRKLDEMARLHRNYDLW